MTRRLHVLAYVLTSAIADVARAVFYTGRHHVHTAPRHRGDLVTVATIEARLTREGTIPSIGDYSLTVEVDCRGVSNDVRRLLGMAA